VIDPTTLPQDTTSGGATNATGILAGKKKFLIPFAALGTSLAAFGAGFSDCLFDLETVDACVAHAQSWIQPFRDLGDHLIAWLTAIIKAAFQ